MQNQLVVTVSCAAAGVGCHGAGAERAGGARGGAAACRSVGRAGQPLPGLQARGGPGRAPPLPALRQALPRPLPQRSHHHPLPPAPGGITILLLHLFTLCNTASNTLRSAV